MTTEKICAHYFDEQGQKKKIASEELFIELPNGQILTLSITDVDLYIADHSPGHEEFAVLFIQPSACNSLRINSILHPQKS